MVQNLTIPYDELAELSKRYQIRRVLLFGSALRDDFRPDSDVDVLVEFEPQARIGLFEMVDLQSELESLLNRRVDLGTPAGLSKYIRKKVMETAQVIYERP